MWMKTSRLRVLTTKWICEDWVKLMENPNLMRSAFSRTGLSLPLNGSRDSEIRFDGEGVDPITVDSDDESDSDENDAENSKSEVSEGIMSDSDSDASNISNNSIDILNSD